MKYVEFPVLGERRHGRGRGLRNTTLEQLNDQQRPFADEILKVTSIGMSGSFNQYDVAQPGREPAHVCHARLPAFHHFRTAEAECICDPDPGAALYIASGADRLYPLALKAGLLQAVADELNVGKRPASTHPDEATVCDFKDHAVSDATFTKARELFGDQQIVDLITVA